MKVVCQLKRTELGRHEKNKETVLCCHTDLFEAAHRIGYYSLRKTAPHHDVFLGMGKLRNTLNDVENRPRPGVMADGSKSFPEKLPDREGTGRGVGCSAGKRARRDC
jgi:hypothetical protein